MPLTLEAYLNGAWVDKTASCLGLRWKISSQSLESVEAELAGALDVGTQLRLRRNDTIVFEGIVYESERSHRAGDVVKSRITAYNNLILYDRHIVFRTYSTGTTAGAIIRDLANLEAGVDTTNVEDGPSLNSPWIIENEVALNIMQNIARGTNFWLRMKPGKKIYYRQKKVGTSTATLTADKIVSAEYSEDRWKLKNRVIYIGANGIVLADVSEPPGDSPLVVSDPFLTDAIEAQRRANIRLALNKEYGRQLNIVMNQAVFESLSLDLGDTAAINLPSLGLNNTNMYLVEIEYHPDNHEYSLTFGGKLELFEQFFEEAVGGDVAARFGQMVSVPEFLGSTMTTVEEVSTGIKMMASTRYPVYVNKPRLNLYSPVNVIVDSNGFAALASGATEGSFENSILPESRLFSTFIKCEWIARKNQGNVSVDILTADAQRVLTVNNAEDTWVAYVPRWPKGFGGLTTRTSSSWGASGASVTDAKQGLLNNYCLKLTPLTQGVSGEIWYPLAKNLGLSLGFARYLRLYLYGDHAEDFTITVRLYQDANNYLSGKLTVKHDTWAKYEAVLSTFTKNGNPTTMNWLSISSPYNLLVDSDYALLSLTRETLKLKFTLTRGSADMTSPQVKLVKIVWREGDYG